MMTPPATLNAPKMASVTLAMPELTPWSMSICGSQPICVYAMEDWVPKKRSIATAVGDFHSGALAAARRAARSSAVLPAPAVAWVPDAGS